MTFLSPRLLMPIFLKFTPLEDGALREAILALAQKLDFPVKEVSIVAVSYTHLTLPTSDLV